MTDLGLNAITPHNPVVFGNKLYVSWYQAGVQVFDITQRSQLRRIGQYDAFPNTFRPETAVENIASEPWDLVCGTDNLQNLLPTTYDGTWAVFPLLGESKIIVGDMSSGLLILDATGAGMPQRNRISDFDGDRATDAAVYRPSHLSAISMVTAETIGRSFDPRPVFGTFWAPPQAFTASSMDCLGISQCLRITMRMVGMMPPFFVLPLAFGTSCKAP